MVNINNICQSCNSFIQNCQLCSPLGCSACITSYSLFINSTTSSCTLQCPTGYISIIINNITQCVQCTAGCASCNTVTTNCTACIAGYYYYLNSCVLNCPTALIIINGRC